MNLPLQEKTMAETTDSKLSVGKHGTYGTKHWYYGTRLWRFIGSTGEWVYVCPLDGIPCMPRPYYGVKAFDHWTEPGKIYTRDRVCWGQCAARNLRRSLVQRLEVDQDDFTICYACGRLMGRELVCCDTCSRFFKGPKRNFSIDYECEECELNDY